MDFPDWSQPIVPGLFQLKGSGVKLVAVTGTAVAIHAATVSQVIVLKSRSANVGTVYVGISTVTNDETPATGGFQMDAGDVLTFSDTNLADVFINGAAGDGVSFLWW